MCNRLVKNAVIYFYTVAPQKMTELRPLLCPDRGYQETVPRKVEKEVLRLVKDVETGSDARDEKTAHL